MHVYEVGKPYHPGVTHWPETPSYAYRSGGHELVLFLRSPAPRECAAVHAGRISLALYEDQPLLVFCYQFAADVPWGDAPYSWWLMPKEERSIPTLALGERGRAILSILLVDAQTGLIKAMRAVAMPHDFTLALHQAIRRQADVPWDAQRYDALLAATYQGYPTSQLLAERAAQHRVHDAGA